MSHFRKTGNIRLLRSADISLEKEILSIKVIGDYTIIQAEYTLKNTGKNRKYSIGFLEIKKTKFNWDYKYY